MDKKSYRKRIILMAIGLFQIILIFAQEHQQPKVAVVLSGGGAKGFAHIGALKVLEEQGIPIDIIVGTSMGSIVGGLYSLGYSAEEIEVMAKSQDWIKLLSDDVSRTQLSKTKKIANQRYVLSLPTDDNHKPSLPQGAKHGQNVVNLFCNLAGNVPVNADFDDFPIRFACIGTDLATGKEVIIDNGFFPSAIYSSMAIPGVFMPSKHNGYVMIDGGLANNFPADIAKNMGADIIIGVDIRDDLHDIDNISSIKEVSDQLINFFSIEKDSINKSYCSVLIKPDITGYNVSSFNSQAVDTLVLRGEKATKKMLTELQHIKNKYNLSSKHVSRNYIKSDTWDISVINLTGHYHLNDKLILDNLRLTVPGSYTYQEIKEAIDRVYGLGCFEKVYFKFITQKDGEKILSLVMEEQSSSGFNLGLRWNTTDDLSLLLNYSQYDYKRYLGNFSITADISSNPGINLYGEISKGKRPVFGIELNGKYQDYKFFANGNKISTSEIYYGEGKGFLYQSINRSSTAGVGVSFEFYHGDFFAIESDTLINFPTTNTTITNAYAFFAKDNLDDYYFPTRGMEFYTELTFLDDENFNNINPVIYLKLRSVIPVTKNLSALINLYGRAILSNTIPVTKQTFVGGHSYELYFKNHLPFYGIPAITLAQQYTYTGLAGLRVKVYRNHYVSFLCNALLQTDDFAFTKQNTIETGYAIDYNFNSGIGPIGFTCSYSPWYNKPVMSANVGFWF